MWRETLRTESVERENLSHPLKIILAGSSSKRSGFALVRYLEEEDP